MQQPYLNISCRVPSASSLVKGPPTVAYQGVPGAYSEMAVQELFSSYPGGVRPVPRESFPAAFGAVEKAEVDYGLLPFENTLGGSIHASYDLCMSHNLHVIAEHQFRVRHCLMVVPGVTRDKIRKVTSHSQALAQCEWYIRKNGWEPEPAYDTAGSAKIVKEKNLLDTAVIAGESAASTYGLEILDSGIEDNSNNFTRFLLLSRDAVTPAPHLAAKTSVMFSLVDAPGVLFKALGCFALRDIDLLKIESRPSKNIPVEFRETSPVEAKSARARSPSLGNRLSQVVFYVDFLANTVEERTSNALRHLREFAPYLRVLGCYPVSPAGGPSSPLVLPREHDMASPMAERPIAAPSSEGLRIGIVGFGTFGQFLAAKFRERRHQVFASSRTDYSEVAGQLGVQFFRSEGEMLAQRLDVIVLSVSILSFEGVLRAFPLDRLAGLLVVDVLSVKVHPKNLLTQLLPAAADILCTHPMFGPVSGKAGWNNLPMVYEKVRVTDNHRCVRFLEIFEQSGCRMVPMRCEEHDRYAAGSQFITHLTGRMLGTLGIRSTPINTVGFETLLKLMENTCADSFDLFMALYRHNPNAKVQMDRLLQALLEVKGQLEQGGPEKALPATASAASNSSATSLM